MRPAFRGRFMPAGQAKMVQARSIFATRGDRQVRVIAVQPAACPTLTRGPCDGGDGLDGGKTSIKLRRLMAQHGKAEAFDSGGAETALFVPFCSHLCRAVGHTG